MQHNMNRLPPVSTLISPPEAKPLDSFDSSSLSPSSQQPQQQPQQPQQQEQSRQTVASSSSSIREDNTLPPISAERKRSQSDMNLPSPPVTPYIGYKKKRDASALEQTPAPVAPQSANVDVNANNNHSNKDPVLFPPEEPTSSSRVPVDQPLFGYDDDEVIDQHIAKRRKKAPYPTRAEYKIVTHCASRAYVSIAVSNYNRNPSAYAKEERAILDGPLVAMKPYSPHNLKRIAPAPAKKGQNGGTSRPQRPQRAKRTPKSTPSQKTADSFSSPARSTPKPTRVIGTNRDDTDYNSLPDYAPPVDTLRGNSKALKADWKGQMLDLSNDPDRDMLDPAEVNLAATLRLSCATYLCSKRRIFEARLNALRRDKEFRKTDAQQACKIDVNKASKLWTAYDRVGWFKPEYVRQFL